MKYSVVIAAAAAFCPQVATSEIFNYVARFEVEDLRNDLGDFISEKSASIQGFVQGDQFEGSAFSSAPAPYSSLSRSQFTGEDDISVMGVFAIDTDANTITYDLPEGLVGKGKEVSFNGFAPVGWEGRELFVLSSEEQSKGVWKFDERDQTNILDGLAYLAITDTQRGTRARAQLDMPFRPMLPFERRMARDVQAGTCHLSISLDGLLPEVEVDMDPAQVAIIRGLPFDANADGKFEVPLEVEVRVGGGYVPGLGRIDIEMLDTANPGLVMSESGNGFPADMSMQLQKRYKTPFGTFIGGVETYEAKGITRFPPFGAELTPTTEVIPLFNEQTNEQVGYARLGNIVPLFGVNKDDFPIREIEVGPERPSPLE